MNKNAYLLITILVTIVLVINTITISFLYTAAFEQQRQSLEVITHSQARLMEAVAQFDAIYSENDNPEGSAAATLHQIRSAYKNYEGFGKTGELAVAKLENNDIIFLSQTRFNHTQYDHLLFAGGPNAQPMQWALSGKAGTIIARDYRGVMVLAAYEFVATLNYGVIAKIDLDEVRKPFIRVGLISVALALLLIAIGSLLFLRITQPLTKRLIESETRLNEAQRLAKVGSWELNLLTGRLIWSDEIFNIFEIDKSIFAPSYVAFLDAIHADDRDAVNKAYSDSLINYTPYEIVHRLKMEDGRIKFVRETCESFFDADDKPLRSVGTVQDITELHKIELLLQQSQSELQLRLDELTDMHELYKTTFDQASIGIAHVDLKGRFLRVNKCLQDMIGYKEDEFNTLSFQEITCQDDLKKDLDRLHELLEGNIKTYSLEKRYICKDGTIIWCYLSVSLINDVVGIPQYIVAVIQNISREKTAEESLRKSEERFDLAIQGSNDGIWDWNILSGEEWWSPLFYELLGYRNGEVEASYQKFSDKIHAEDKDRVDEAIRSHLEERKEYDIEFRLQLKSGEYGWFLSRGHAVWNDDGTPVRMLGSLRDIRERKHIENELVQHRNHLEELVLERTRELKDTQQELVRKERLATLGQLTATVSHELRNPLAAMSPSLYIIRKLFDSDDPKIHNALNRIETNIARCDRIIDEMLDFTRITDLDAQPQLLDDWLMTVLNDQGCPQGVSLKYALSLPELILPFDPERLRRAIINVYDNACHAMQLGDDANRVVNGATVGVATRHAGERIEIIITDNGHGIPKESLEKVFEPLFSTKGFGVGLGMPTVKQIMGMHGGGIEIDSEAGHGTRITLWLPLSRQSEVAA